MPRYIITLSECGHEYVGESAIAPPTGLAWFCIKCQLKRKITHARKSGRKRKR